MPGLQLLPLLVTKGKPTRAGGRGVTPSPSPQPRLKIEIKIIKTKTKKRKLLTDTLKKQKKAIPLI